MVLVAFRVCCLLLLIACFILVVSVVFVFGSICCVLLCLCGLVWVIVSFVCVGCVCCWFCLVCLLVSLVSLIICLCALYVALSSVRLTALLFVACFLLTAYLRLRGEVAYFVLFG